MRKCVRGVSPCCNEKNVHFYQFIFRDKKITHTQKKTKTKQTGRLCLLQQQLLLLDFLSMITSLSSVNSYAAAIRSFLHVIKKVCVDLRHLKKHSTRQTNIFCMFPWRFFCFPPKQTLLQFSQVFTVSASV